MTRPDPRDGDPLTLPETAGAALDPGTHVIVGIALVAWYVALGLIVGVDKLYAFIAGMGAMGVGVLAWRWMERQRG